MDLLVLATSLHANCCVKSNDTIIIQTKCVGLIHSEHHHLIDLLRVLPLIVYGWFKVFNATFYNISAISWQSVLLMEETWIFGENHRRVASHRQMLPHNVVSSTPGHELTSLVVMGNDCTASCKSNYHTITATTAPRSPHDIAENCSFDFIQQPFTHSTLIELEKTNTTDKSSSYSDLHLEIPFICCKLPAAPAYGVYIS